MKRSYRSSKIHNVSRPRGLLLRWTVHPKQKHSQIRTKLERTLKRMMKEQRELIESLTILNYPDILCNAGPSTNISDMWFGCTARLRSALTE